MFDHPSSTVAVSVAVFLNLFSEAEPFAAILIAHGIHVFLPEGPKFKA